MSLVQHTVSPKRVAANQANSQKSTGPKTEEGKARAALNALKTGAYVKTNNARREILLRRDGNLVDFDQFHQRLTERWSPGDVMQEMLVKSIAEKSSDLEQLRAGWIERRLTAVYVADIQARRRDLLSRRWCPGVPAVEPAARGLWQAEDSPSKFKKIYDILDLLQKWFEEKVCPDKYPEAMNALYGECPSLAGERIRLLFIQFVGSDEVGTAKAAQQLPEWIARERRYVDRERDLFRDEMALRDGGGPNLTEEQVNAREVDLEKQIAEQSRLLLQLKRNQSQWAPRDAGNREQRIGNREQDQTAVATEPVTADAGAVPHAGPASSPSGLSSGPSSGTVSDQSAIPTNGQNGDETAVGG
ncbi:MAG TPA: hypothetical protein VKM93_04325 [Terriglobia bacterium]|nr:hypothetical protein [Terriglobia bacterium]